MVFLFAAQEGLAQCVDRVPIDFGRHPSAVLHMRHGTMMGAIHREGALRDARLILVFQRDRGYLYLALLIAIGVIERPILLEYIFDELVDKISIG